MTGIAPADTVKAFGIGLLGNLQCTDGGRIFTIRRSLREVLVNIYESLRDGFYVDSIRRKRHAAD